MYLIYYCGYVKPHHSQLGDYWYVSQQGVVGLHSDRRIIKLVQLC